MLSLPRCSRSSALASFVICSWVFLILGLLSYFSSHALIPRSIFSEAFDTAIETFEATNVTALIWRIQHPGSDTTGLAGDDALLESLDSGEGDETESDGENEDADSTGDDTAADSGEGDADHAAQPDQPAQIDSQITRDLQPWAERGIRLYDLWATKHNFSSYTPRWEPLANEGRVVYSQAFDSSGLVRRKQRPKRVDLTAGLRKRLEVLAREREEKEAAGAREQEDDGEEDESDSKDESGTSKKRRLGSRKGKNSKSTKKSKGKDSNSTAPAGSSISSGASEEVEEEERWGGLGANMYEGVEDLDGRPIGLFEMWVVDGVPYMDATDVASAFATFYFGMLLKIHATLWAMRTSVVYRHKRGIQASPDQGEAYRASLGVNTTKEAAEFTAGIVPDTYLLVNIDPFPVLARRAQARPPGTGAVAEAVAPAPRPMAPVLSLCKTDADMDVLYPNPYFVSPTKWGAQVTRMRAVNRAHPWRTRKDTVWWRGSAGNHWPGSAPRIFTVSRWRNAKWSDFAFTDRYASSYYAWRKRWRRSVFRARIPKQSVKIRSGPEHAMPMERVGEYQYALHLPGFYAGTYSRMLQFLLWSGTVVFKLDNPYYEFYYHHIKPWVHFVPVNNDNLGDRVAMYRRNESRGLAVVANAARVARSVLSPDAISSYWVDLLTQYAKIQAFNVSDATRGRQLCTCWPVKWPPPGPDGVIQPDPDPEAVKPAWVTVPGATYCGQLCRPRAIYLNRSLHGPTGGSWQGYGKRTAKRSK